MITVILHGELADICTEQITIAVHSVAEAIAALRANFPKFVNYLYEAAQRGVNYQVKVGYQEIDDSQLCSPISKKVNSIRIVPVVAGTGTVGRIIGGVALLGLGLAGVGFLGISSTTLALTGGAMLLGGISSLFGRKSSSQGSEKSPGFNNPAATIEEGGRVPIMYGVYLASLYIVSAKVVTFLTK